ncbi:MAG: ExbD/TolR family protein [Akkermansiaceae bacterium]
MKLQSTLPEGVGFLHAVPLFNLFAVLLMCYTLGPKLEEKTGVSIQMPASLFQLERYEEAAVVTMTADGGGELYVGSQRIQVNELDARLDEQLLSSSGANRAIVIMADRLVPSEQLRQVAEICLRKGLRVVMAGSGRGKPGEIREP